VKQVTADAMVGARYADVNASAATGMQSGSNAGPAILTITMAASN
jgi:hypothetical protein